MGKLATCLLPSRVRNKEASLLQMALKQSLIDGFERNELRYCADACPEAVWVTTIDAEQHSQLQQ